MADLPRFANERVPDHILSDLGRKLDDDVTSDVSLTVALLSNPADRAVIAVLGCARMLGIAITYFEQTMPGAVTKEELVDALWQTRLRPALLSAIGGGSLRELLRKADGRHG